jgi:hypothetical protein
MFSEQGFEKHRKNTRREQFLEDMDQIIPWKELAAPSNQSTRIPSAPSATRSASTVVFGR